MQPPPKRRGQTRQTKNQNRSHGVTERKRMREKKKKGREKKITAQPHWQANRTHTLRTAIASHGSTVKTADQCHQHHPGILTTTKKREDNSLPTNYRLQRQ